MIHLTEEQRLAVERTEGPVRLTDPRSKREYLLVQADVYEKLKRILAAEEIDASLYEFTQPIL